MRSQSLIVITGLSFVVAGAFGGCAQAGSAGFFTPPLAGAAGATVGTGGLNGGGSGGTSAGSGGWPTSGAAGAGAEGGVLAACDAEETLCSGECVDVTLSRQHCGACGVACTGDQICNTGGCECPYELCGGEEGTGAGAVCVDTSTSLVHCGACYAPCRLGETCTDGVCACQDASLTRCGALCVDTATDPTNCGACGVACEGTQVCSQSECRDDCLAPESRCDQSDGTVLCADLQTSSSNCGACDNACEVGYTCNARQCGCPPGTELCGNTCVNTQESLAHCGGCDANCTHVCEAGVCVCGEGLVACAADCVDLQLSNSHCGECDTACLTGSSCAAGACACDEGLAPCPDVEGSGCTDLSSDDVNCGACGAECGADASCLSGACSCDEAGLAFCAGACVDLDYDPAHCGSCETTCAEGQICQAGTCETPALVARTTEPSQTNQLALQLQVCNQSEEPVSLSGITVRYWYTVDGTGTLQQGQSDYSTVGATVTATRVNPALTAADFYFTVTISGSPSLAARACHEFLPRVWGNYSDYIFTNDHSYLEGATSQANENVTIYQNDNLIWGTEPGPI